MKLILPFFYMCSIIIALNMPTTTQCSAAAESDSKASPELQIATAHGISIEDASSMIESHELIQLNANPTTQKDSAFFKKTQKCGAKLSGIIARYPDKQAVVSFCTEQNNTLKQIYNGTLG